MLQISFLGGLRTFWLFGCAPNDSTNGIGCYRTQNDRLVKCGIGSEGFPQICSDAPSITPTVLPEELRPKWLNESISKISPSESDDRWLNRSALAGSQMGWKETAIWIRVSCNSPNPQTSLRPHWLSCAVCNEYS